MQEVRPGFLLHLVVEEFHLYLACRGVADSNLGLGEESVGRLARGLVGRWGRRDHTSKKTVGLDILKFFREGDCGRLGRGHERVISYVQRGEQGCANTKLECIGEGKRGN